METMTNTNAVVDTAEEIAMKSSNGCLKKLGVIGGIVALGALGCFVVKKIKDNKESIVDEFEDAGDTDLLNEDVDSDEE